MIYLDTETCGLVGPIVLMQYAEDDGEICLYEPWKHKVQDTLDLIEGMCSEIICGFNLAFDWFHLCQMYTTMLLLDPNKLPDITEYALAEEHGRLGPCLKPKGALDLMLHARKGPYQSTMQRNPIKIRRVPTQLAWKLAEELGNRIKLKSIYFSRGSDTWQVEDIEGTNDFKNLVLRFSPTSALKALISDAFNIDTESITRFADVEPPKKARPIERGYAPFATAPYRYKNVWGDWLTAHPSPKDWCHKWPDYGKITVHMDHWATNVAAREYASNDVKYLRMLEEFFEYPKHSDTDSLLACMVGAIRWRGYAIDLEYIKRKRMEIDALITNPPCNFNSSDVCKIYMKQVLSEQERAALVDPETGAETTKEVILEEIATWENSITHEACNGFGCEECGYEGLIKNGVKHPAAIRAQQILDYRHSKKEHENYIKLEDAGRFHVDLQIIGTRSNRKSGGKSGLNAQGIKKALSVRRAFTLADNGMVLSGGDFESFEVSIQVAVYNDPKLKEDLLREHDCFKCSGKGCDKCKGTGKERYKIHGLFSMSLHKGKSYIDILKTKGLGGNQDLYDKGKRGVFAISYGGDYHTLANRLGIPEELGKAAYEDWIKRYVVWGEARKKIFDRFCSMRQPKGLGTVVEWHEPAEYVESIFGFKRYFTLENRICKTLFELAEKPPKQWESFKIKVVRRADRGEQTAVGALRSSLFAAAFGIQGDNMRAAANHEIQSPGATETKELELCLWNHQPIGIHDWRVMPFNMHDEIMCPHIPELKDPLEQTVTDFVNREKKNIPLLEMEWKQDMKTWADK